MDHADGWSGGGMRLWTAIGLAVVVVLIAVIGKRSKKIIARSPPANSPPANRANDPV